MNILMTADGVGGIWNHVLELAEGLQQYCVSIHLVVFGGKLSAAQCAEVNRLENVSCRQSDLRLEWMDDPWQDLRVAGELLHSLAAEVRPDVLHLNGYALAAKGAWPAPVVVGAHSCVLSWWQAVKQEVIPQWLHRYHEEVSQGLGAADRVVTPTHKMLADLRGIYKVGFSAVVIANGIEPSPFSRGSQEPHILSAGRLWDEAKNFQLLDSVANKLKWPILVAGGSAPPNSSAVRGFSHLRAIGRLSSPELRSLLSRTPIYAAPALYEPFGLAVLEAALSGCALVLADIGSFQELWQGAAVLVDPFDAHAWAAELDRLISDKKSRTRLAEAAYSRAKSFSRDAMASRYHELYRDLAASRRELTVEQAA